jgi:hypothetical protein
MKMTSKVAQWENLYTVRKCQGLRWDFAQNDFRL